MRIVDTIVNELNLGALGFEGADPAATGRPGYHPSVLLMWLSSHLTPDFHRDNGKGIRYVCRSFIVLC